MLKLSLKIFLTVLLVVLQLSLMPIFSISGVWPNVILILAIILMMSRLEEDALIIAGVGGLVLDLASPFIFGLNTFLILSTVLLVRYLDDKFFSETNTIVVSIMTGLFSLLLAIIFMFLSKNWLLSQLLVEFLYGFAAGMIVYSVSKNFIRPNQAINVIFGKD